MKSVKILTAVSAIALGSAMAPAASAATVLTFEGVANQVAVGDFYNGGAGGNLGISFSNGFGLIDADDGGSGNFANEPSSGTVLYFISGSASTMNVAAGFIGGVSFYYSSAAAASVNVFSGLDGTGDLLGTLSLSAQASDNCGGDPTGTFCNFTATGLDFAGTARSVSFNGSANLVAFDDITLGSSTPGAVPETATWGMMILGFGMVGGAARYRRRSAKLTFA